MIIKIQGDEKMVHSYNPEKIKILINQKVARKIGIEIPAAVLGQADEVFQ